MNGKRAHGFRKYYKSHAEQVMKPINVEITMGHNIGISASYYKPTEREVLEDYLKAAPLLTINADNLILQKKVEELTEKSKDNEYIIKAKLLDKENTVQKMREEHNRDIALLKEEMRNMQRVLDNIMRT